MPPKRIIRLLVLFLGLLCLLLFKTKIESTAVSVLQLMRGKSTIEDRLEQFGSLVRARLGGDFARVGVEYPPARITLVGIKDERLLEVWVAGSSGTFKLLKTYPILGMSGVLGPKLREGDLQVPEGVYRAESLNPNSLYHLAIRVNYPNEMDLQWAEKEGRANPGSDIMIHGKTSSIGCLAMGDSAAEDLFVLAAQAGVENVAIILTPVDFSKTIVPTALPAEPKWIGSLYEHIKASVSELRSP